VNKAGYAKKDYSLKLFFKSKMWRCLLSLAPNDYGVFCAHYFMNSAVTRNTESM